MGLLPTVGGNVSFLNEVLVSMSVSLMKVLLMSVFVNNCRFQCQFLWKSGGNVGFVLPVIIIWAGGTVTFIYGAMGGNVSFEVSSVRRMMVFSHVGVIDGSANTFQWWSNFYYGASDDF